MKRSNIGFTSMYVFLSLSNVLAPGALVMFAPPLPLYARSGVRFSGALRIAALEGTAATLVLAHGGHGSCDFGFGHFPIALASPAKTFLYSATISFAIRNSWRRR